jgi:WD40 repeat protein
MNRTLIGCFVALLGLTVSALAGTDQTTPELKLIVIDQAPPDLKDVTSRLWTVVFSPNGKHLATAAWDRVVKIWDLETREPIATLGREKR